MQFLGKARLLKISTIFGLGDTFEVYAVKKDISGNPERGSKPDSTFAE
jgi:hypothetical protein